MARSHVFTGWLCLSFFLVWQRRLSVSIHAFWYPGGSVGWGMSAQNSGSQERQHHSEQGLTYLSTGCMCMNPCMHSVCLEAWLFILYRWATERQVPQSQSFLPWHLPVGHHSLERASCPNNINSPKKKKLTLILVLWTIWIWYVRAVPTSSYQMSVKIHSRLLNLADPVLIRLAFAQHEGRASLWWRVSKDTWWDFFMEDGLFLSMETNE